jgi:hypothetical protein
MYQPIAAVLTREHCPKDRAPNLFAENIVGWIGRHLIAPECAVDLPG